MSQILDGDATLDDARIVELFSETQNLQKICEGEDIPMEVNLEQKNIMFLISN